MSVQAIDRDTASPERGDLRWGEGLDLEPGRRRDPVRWDPELTARLIALYRQGEEYFEIAEHLGLLDGQVKSKEYLLRASGVLQPRPKDKSRKRRCRSSPPRTEWDPQLTADVIEFRREGLYHKQITAKTGLTPSQLTALMRELLRDGRVSQRVPLLSADTVRNLHRE
jgi:transposase-like protein